MADDAASTIVRVPPHDLDAEAAVLSAVMVDPSALDHLVDFLEARHFYSEAHRRIYEAAMDLHAEGKPVDVVQVAGWLRDRERLGQVGGMEYITRVLNAAPAVVNVRSYGETVHAKWRVREIQLHARRVLEEGYHDTGDVQEFADGVAREFHEIAYASSTGAELTEIRVTLSSAFAKLHAATKSGRFMVGVPTGIERLDRVIGGLHEGDLTILAARPGNGKSSLALQWAMCFAMGAHPSAFFTLEMPKEQLSMRAACAEGRVNVSLPRTGGLTPRDWSALTTATEKLMGLPLFLDETPGLTVMAMRARMRRLNAELERAGKKPIRLAVVDYLQLARGSGKARNALSRESEVAEIAQDLKELAKDMSCSVVALSQMNRAIETGGKRRPRLSDLRESGNIEQAGDNIIFIHDPEEQPGIVELCVEKQRNGPTDSVTVRFDKQYTRFENIAEEYDRRGGSGGYANEG